MVFQISTWLGYETEKQDFTFAFCNFKTIYTILGSDRMDV